MRDKRGITLGLALLLLLAVLAGLGGGAPAGVVAQGLNAPATQAAFDPTCGTTATATPSGGRYDGRVDCWVDNGTPHMRVWQPNLGSSTDPKEAFTVSFTLPKGAWTFNGDTASLKDSAGATLAENGNGIAVENPTRQIVTVNGQGGSAAGFELLSVRLDDVQPDTCPLIDQARILSAEVDERRIVIDEAKNRIWMDCVKLPHGGFFSSFTMPTDGGAFWLFNGAGELRYDADRDGFPETIIAGSLSQLVTGLRVQLVAGGWYRFEAPAGSGQLELVRTTAPAPVAGLVYLPMALGPAAPKVCPTLADDVRFATAESGPWNVPVTGNQYNTIPPNLDYWLQLQPVVANPGYYAAQIVWTPAGGGSPKADPERYPGAGRTDDPALTYLAKAKVQPGWLETRIAYRGSGKDCVALVYTIKVDDGGPKTAAVELDDAFLSGLSIHEIEFWKARRSEMAKNN